MIMYALAAIMHGQLEFSDLLTRPSQQQAPKPIIEIRHPPYPWPGRFDLLRQADHPMPKDTQ